MKLSQNTHIAHRNSTLVRYLVCLCILEIMKSVGRVLDGCEMFYGESFKKLRKYERMCHLLGSEGVEIADGKSEAFLQQAWNLKGDKAIKVSAGSVISISCGKVIFLAPGDLGDQGTLFFKIIVQGGLTIIYRL